MRGTSTAHFALGSVSLIKLGELPCGLRLESDLFLHCFRQLIENIFNNDFW